MLKLSPKELKAIVKIRGIKVYKSISEDKLLSALSSTKPAKKSENSFEDPKPRIEKIKKEFNEELYSI